MCKILLPSQKTIEISNIIGFGCSLTQGSELADQEKYQKFTDDVEKLKRTLGMKRFWEYNHDIVVTDPSFVAFTEKHIIPLENERSYLGQLGGMMGVSVMNFAKAGSSIDHIILQLIDKKDFIKNSSLTVIGLTSMYRDLLFTTKEHNFIFHDIHFNNYYQLDRVYNSKEFSKIYMKRYMNDETILWNFFNNLITLINVAEELTKGNFVILPIFRINLSYDDIKVNRDNYNLKFAKIAKSFPDILNNKLNKYLLDVPIFSENIDGKDYLGGGHPNYNGHKKFAKLLYDKLVTK